MTSPRPPKESIAPARHLTSFVAGLGVSMVASGGLLADRLTQGDLRVALVAHLLLTVALVGLVQAVRLRGASGGALALGGALGIALAHSWIRGSAFGTAPWLSERPAQLVNDAVAVFAPLAMGWAASRRPPNTAVLVSALVLVTLYRATGSMWHLDRATFSYSVQDLVAGEFAGSALGVAAFRLLAT